MKRVVWGKLTRAWRLHLVLLAILVALTTLLVSVSLGAGSVGAASAIDEAVEPLGDAPAYTITTRQSADPDAQDATIREVVAERLGVPHTVTRGEPGEGSAPFVEWTVTVPSSSLDTESIPALVGAGDEIRLALRNTDAMVRGMDVVDSLTPAIEPIAGTLAPIQSLSLVPALLLLTVSVIVVIQAAATLPRSRERSLRILDARGASRPRLAFHTALETALAGGLGAAAGVALARLVLQQWGGGPLYFQIAAGSALAVGLVAASSRLSVTAAHPVTGRGVARRLDAVAILLVVAVLAGITLYRLMTGGLDTVSAPAVGLTALTGSLLALVVVAPLGVILAGIVARRRSLVAPLAFRFAARRQSASAPAALLVALAVASMTLAAGFDGTERATRERDEQLVRGADVRFELSRGVPGRPSLSSADFADIAGVSQVLGVRVSEEAVAQERGTVVIIPPDQAEGIVDSELTDAFPLEPAGTQVEPGPVEVSVALRLADIERVEPQHDIPARALVSVSFADADGVLRQVAAAPVEITLDGEVQSLSVEIDVPEGVERLIGADVRLEFIDLDAVISAAPWFDYENEGPYTPEDEERLWGEFSSDGYLNLDSWYTIELEGLSWHGEAIDVESGGSPPPFSYSAVKAYDWEDMDGLAQFSLTAPLGSTRIDGVVTPQLAEMFAAGVGETFGVTLDGPTLNVTVVGISDQIPGADQELVVLLDQRQLTELRLAEQRAGYGPSEIWMMLDGSRSVEDVVADALAIDPGGSQIDTRVDQTLAAGTTGWAFWAVAVAAVGLALVGLISVRLSESGEAAREAQVLRSLGATPRQVGRAHRGELYARAVPAVVGGALVGVLLAYAVMPALVSLANGTVREPVVTVAWLPLGAALALLTLGIVIVARVRRRS